MHAPDHAGDLPPGVDPMPMPDTKEDAKMLLILLDAGLSPKCEPDQNCSEESD